MARSAFLPRWWPVLLLLPTLATLVLQAGWGFNGLYTQDAHAYLRLARALSSWWSGGAPPGPAYWPLGYPTLGALLAWVTGDVLVALRIIPILAWVALILGFRRILLDTGAERNEASFFTLLTVGTSPFLLRHGVVVMSDVPALGLAVWSLRFALASPTLRTTLTCFLLASAAVMVRFPMLALVTPFVVTTAWRSGQRASIAQRFVIVLGAVACVALTVRVTSAAMDHPLGQQSALLNLFRRDFDTVDGHRQFPVPNILFLLKPLLHPGFLLLAPLLWFSFRKMDLSTWRVRVIVSSTCAYLLLLGVFPDQNDRLLLPAIPFTALVLWPAFQRLRAHAFILRWQHILLTLMLILQLALFARAMAPFVVLCRTQRELAMWVIDRHPATVYTFGVDQALRSYGFEGILIDIWRTEVVRFEPRALVLFNPTANAAQWKDRAPMLNWERAVAQGADTVVTRADGWVLLRVR